MTTLLKENPVAFMKKIVNRARKKPHLEFFYHLSASLSGIKAPPPKTEVEIKEVSIEDDEILEELAKIKSINCTKAQLSQFLVEGRRCYVAMHNGQLASCYWVLRKGFMYHRNFDLADDEEFQLAGYTYPAFRGMGIIPHLVAVTASERYQHNPNMQVISHVGVTNKASLRTLQKLGFTKDGLVGFFEIFGVRFHFILGHKVFPKTRKRIYFEKM